MADQHPRCKLTNSGLHAPRQAFDGQQELVLLRLDPAGSRLIFTEPQEPADLIAEFRQRLKLTGFKPRRPCCHRHIVARYSFEYQSMPRSEERRVGKECRSRWSPY